jgi:glucose-1-phosphate adenylyltransferase
LSTLRQFRRTLTIILAGGQGERLYPLTKDRSKPAVPFGGNYRIVDFSLSNCYNSGLRRIYVFTQYKSYSLDRHLQRGWNIFGYESGEFLYRVPPQHRVGTKWYRGTVDAVYQNVYLLEKERPDHVLILSGDHVYKMDYAEMWQFHQDHGGMLTLAAAVVPRAGAHHYGIVAVDATGRVTGFQEKPNEPATLPGDPDHCLVNMGVYLYDTQGLVREVCHDARETASTHDFGRDLIPKLVDQGEVYAFPFRDRETGAPAYWRDIGTLDNYYEASMDLVAREPHLDLYDREWPFRTWQTPVPPAKSIYGYVAGDRLPGTIANSIIGGGSVVSGGHVERSVIGRGVKINSYSKVSESILMDGVQIGRHAELHRVICDKEVVVPEGFVIGRDERRDRQHFTVSDRGIVVIPKGLDLGELFS